MRKLGSHCITRSDAALEWARRAPVVKSLGDPYILRQAQPGAITIFRSYFDPYEQDALNSGAALSRIFTQLDGFRPTFIELWNETHQRIGDGLPRHCDAVAACVKPIHDYGSKVAGFSFSVGGPEMEDWLYLRDRGFAGCDAIAIHSYWAKQGFSDWTSLRHRRVHALLGAHVPFVITECGRDAVVQEGGDKQPGWKLQGVSGEDYLNELIAYNAELEKDDYVIGATVFTAGPSPDWWAFDTDEISDLIPGGLPAIGGGTTMDEATQVAMIEMEARQNAALTKALIQLREGRFTGADGLDGTIVELNGGKLPAGYKPVFPKA